jgi:hypothetical protein
MQKTMLDQLKRDLAADGVQPTWWGDCEPLCNEDSIDDCPSHDGKRCEKLGHRPSRHCDVAVAAMGKLLSETGALSAAQSAEARVFTRSVGVPADLIDLADGRLVINLYPADAGALTKQLKRYERALITIANGEQRLDEHTDCLNYWPSASDCARAALAPDAVDGGPLESLQAATCQAARDYAAMIERHLGEVLQEAYAAMIERHLGEVLQEAGLWDGRAETLEAAARSAVGRVVIKTQRPLEAVIVFDGKPARKVSMTVKP